MTMGNHLSSQVRFTIHHNENRCSATHKVSAVETAKQRGHVAVRRASNTTSECSSAGTNHSLEDCYRTIASASELTNHPFNSQHSSSSYGKPVSATSDSSPLQFSPMNDVYQKTSETVQSSATIPVKKIKSRYKYHHTCFSTQYPQQEHPHNANNNNNEEDMEELKQMYDHRTWNMYFRIMKSREQKSFSISPHATVDSNIQENNNSNNCYIQTQLHCNDNSSHIDDEAQLDTAIDYGIENDPFSYSADLNDGISSTNYCNYHDEYYEPHSDEHEMIFGAME